jgi:hypothetical protein
VVESSCPNSASSARPRDAVVQRACPEHASKGGRVDPGGNSRGRSVRENHERNPGTERREERPEVEDSAEPWCQLGIHITIVPHEWRSKTSRNERDDLRADVERRRCTRADRRRRVFASFGSHADKEPNNRAPGAWRRATSSKGLASPARTFGGPALESRLNMAILLLVSRAAAKGMSSSSSNGGGLRWTTTASKES